MAKRSSSRSIGRQGRDAAAIASRRLVLSGFASSRSGRRVRLGVDRREFRPVSFLSSPRRHLVRVSMVPSSRHVRKRSRFPVQLERVDRRVSARDRPTVLFPLRVPLCERRRRRREVLHAKGVAGSKGLRKPRRNLLSKVICGGRRG